VFNTTSFNNISVISWQSVLLVEKSEVPRENHRPATSHCQTLSHNVVSSTPRISRIRTDIGSHKSNNIRSRPRRHSPRPKRGLAINRQYSQRKALCKYWSKRVRINSK